MIWWFNSDHKLLLAAPGIYIEVQASPAKFLQLKSGTGLVARASICSTCMSLRAAARWSAVLPFRSGKLTEAPACTSICTTWDCLVMMARWSGVCRESSGLAFSLSICTFMQERHTHTLYPYVPMNFYAGIYNTHKSHYNQLELSGVLLINIRPTCLMLLAMSRFMYTPTMSFTRCCVRRTFSCMMER